MTRREQILFAKLVLGFLILIFGKVFGYPIPEKNIDEWLKNSEKMMTEFEAGVKDGGLDASA